MSFFPQAAPNENWSISFYRDADVGGKREGLWRAPQKAPNWIFDRPQYLQTMEKSDKLENPGHLEVSSAKNMHIVFWRKKSLLC